MMVAEQRGADAARIKTAEDAHGWVRLTTALDFSLNLPMSGPGIEECNGR
jgi:hypothetical protein